MSNPDDGTTEFKVGGLRDLLESGGEPAPAQGRGGVRPNRQLLFVGGGVAAILIVLLAVVLLGRGGDGGRDVPEDAVGIGVELRKGSGVESRVKEGGKASVCDTAVGPIAEDVVVNKISTGRQILGGETVIVEFLAPPDQAARLGAKPTPTWKVFAASSCPPAITTSSSAPTADTTPVTTPPEPAPSPPPSY